MAGWIPCSKQLPDSDATVLAFFPHHGDEPVWPAYHDGECWRTIDHEELDDHMVTHWMDFPEPPEN